MAASKHLLPRSLRSDLAKVAPHVIQPDEYGELPELTEEMVARGAVNTGVRPRAENPKQLISIRLPEKVIMR